LPSALRQASIQFDLGKKNPNTWIIATFLLTLLSLQILFNKPPATLDVRNKETVDDLFIPADQLETCLQPSMVISKTLFSVFCRACSPFHFVSAPVIHWIHADTPNEPPLPRHMWGTSAGLSM